MPILISIAEGLWSILESTFDMSIEITKGSIETLANLLTGDFEGAKESYIQLWENLWNGFKGIISGIWTMVLSGLKSIRDMLLGSFGDLPGQAMEWGKNMISGFVEGIREMGRNIAESAKNFIGTVGDFIGFQSPAKRGEGRKVKQWGAIAINDMTETNKIVSPFENNSAERYAQAVGSQMAIDPSYENGEKAIKKLMIELYHAFSEGNNIIMDGKVIGSTGQLRQEVEKRFQSSEIVTGG